MPLDPRTILVTDRVALVTGAAVGIGRAVSVAFARFGADVAVCDRDAENLAGTVREIEHTGRRAFSARFDVRDVDAIRTFIESVVSDTERIDILVNNAGGGFRASFLELSGKGQEAIVRENFSSVADCVRTVVPFMPPSGGAIINITSVEAHRAAPGYAVYAAMKAGVANLTRSLALELGDRNVRVNCIAPDMIPTPGVGEPGARTPLHRKGHVDDVAGAAVYLASDLARFVTGSTLHVDGGTWAAGGWRRNETGDFRV